VCGRCGATLERKKRDVTWRGVALRDPKTTQSACNPGIRKNSFLHGRMNPEAALGFVHMYLLAYINKPRDDVD